jgi:hypothetical protein
LGIPGTEAIVTFVMHSLAAIVALPIASASLLDADAMSAEAAANFVVEAVTHAVSLQAHAAA